MENIYVAGKKSMFMEKLFTEAKTFQLGLLKKKLYKITTTMICQSWGI